MAERHQSTSGMTTITIRVPLQMVDALDKVVLSEKKKSMGAPYTRSDAVRDLVRTALQTRRESP